MLYTFSQASYDQQELENYILSTDNNDAIVCWLDGVVAFRKYKELFQRAQCSIYLLTIDCNARNINVELSSKVKQIELSELIELTNKYPPQLAL